MDTEWAEVNQKLDALTGQVAYLSEQARLAARDRRDRAELMRDLTPIANEAFRLTVEQLEEVQEYVDLSDLLRLLKRVLRNGRNVERLLDQLESLSDLADTVGPLADDAFVKAVDVMSSLDQKGLFAYARRAVQGPPVCRFCRLCRLLRHRHTSSVAGSPLSGGSPTPSIARLFYESSRPRPAACDVCHQTR